MRFQCLAFRILVVLLAGSIGAAAAVAAPTFPAAPTDCAAVPEDCAGSALASPNSTRGIAADPRLFSAGDPSEVQMFRVTMDTANYPDAVCNDGSPAVFYFAPAPVGSMNRDRWVIQLEGGGGCLEGEDVGGLHQDCMDRWTGKGDALLDFPRMMSTDIDRNGVTDANSLPVEGKVSGLLGVDTVVTDPSQNGGLDAWNRVYINYCSSDLWIGQSGPLALSGGEWVEAGVPQVYEPLDEAWFNGHLILESVLDTIAAGVLSDDQERRIRLDAAPDMIVLAGDSAGGGGVAQNLDYLAGKAGWGADFAGNDRGVTLGVSGATMKPPFVYDDVASDWYQGPTPVMEWDFSIPGSPVLVAVDLDLNGTPDTHSLEAQVPLRRFVYEHLIDAHVDQSCLAANTAFGAADPNRRHWLCYRSPSLFPDGHITTPILVKQDLRDQLLGKGIPNYDIAIRTQMLSLPANFSYFGPECRHHETLSNRSPFMRDRVHDGAGRVVSYHSAIREFIAGTYASIFSDPGVTFRSCAP